MRFGAFSLSQLVQCCLLVSLLSSSYCFAQTSSPRLIANGFATYQELGNDIFIAALYVENPSNDISALQAATNKRLEIKVVSKKLSYRRLGRFFVKAAAINNPPRILVDSARAMERFLSQFRDNFVKGDHIILAGTDTGFQLTINSVDLAFVESPTLLNVLMNAWIGNVPPSRDFKASLLSGEPSLAKTNEFLNLTYVSERAEEIEQWNTENAIIAKQRLTEQNLVNNETQKSDNVVAKVAKSNNTSVAATPANIVDTASIRTAELATTSTTTTTTTTSTSTTTAVKASTNAETNVAASTSADTNSTKNQSDNREVVKDNAANQIASLSTPATKTSATDAAEQQQAAEEVLDELNENITDDEFSAENLLATQLYANKLLIHSQKRMKYPASSLRLKQTGTVVASVTIDREGKLLEYELTELSEFRPLNKAVERGVKRASPYPKIPESMEGEVFKFKLPVVFR